MIGVTSPAKSDKVKSLGAEQVLTRTDDMLRTLGKNSADVVIDLVAGEGWPALLDVLKPFGRYATSGAIAGAHVALDVRTLYLKDLSFYGCTVLDEGVFARLVRRIESGEILPVVEKSFPLDHIAEAQAYFETKQHTGKLVMDLASGA